MLHEAQFIGSHDFARRIDPNGNRDYCTRKIYRDEGWRGLQAKRSQPEN